MMRPSIACLVLLCVLCSVAVSDPTEGEIKLPHCVGGSNHHKRICTRYDSYCGEMDIQRRLWLPEDCRYRDITSAQARKCMGRRTLACIGDNMMRDLCIGVANFLSGITPEMASDFHFEDFAKTDSDRYANATLIGPFKIWKTNAAKNGFIFPKVNSSDYFKWDWQVQIWNLHGRSMLKDGQAEGILSNMMPHHDSNIRKVDFALWNHGLNDWGWFNKPPHGSKYYDLMTGAWLKTRERVEVPSVWVSMNNVCRQWMTNTFMNGKNTPEAQELAYTMVEEANQYVHQKLFEQGLPYFDAAQVFRSPQRCDLSGSNGLYARMWTDVVRAKMLFNHLCDEDFNWVAAPERF